MQFESEARKKCDLGFLTMILDIYKIIGFNLGLKNKYILICFVFLQFVLQYPENGIIKKYLFIFLLSVFSFIYRASTKTY